MIQSTAPAHLVEPATREDLDAVVGLVADAGLPIDGLTDAFPGGYAVVRAGASLVAVAGLEIHGDVGLLRSVAVSEAHRRAGIGRALIGDRLRAACTLELRAVYLLTTTAPDYFRRLGFVDDSRSAAPAALRASAEFAAICPASAVCLSMALPGAAEASATRP